MYQHIILQLKKDDMKTFFVMNENVEIVTLMFLKTNIIFLLVCPRYSELRRKYFSSSYCHWPNLTKFDNLMTSTSKKVLLNVRKFIYHAECLWEYVCLTVCIYFTYNSNL